MEISVGDYMHMTGGELHQCFRNRVIISQPVFVLALARQDEKVH